MPGCLNVIESVYKSLALTPAAYNPKGIDLKKKSPPPHPASPSQFLVLYLRAEIEWYIIIIASLHLKYSACKGL